MGKRRRERDKPKSGPEALYNPNKRVLLSYASDGEEEASTTEQAPVDDRELANYQMDEYGDSEDEEAADLGAAEDEDAPESGGVKVKGGHKEHLPRRDPITQQYPTLGPVSYEEDEEEEYDPETEEAMAYLRAVRSERQTIPDIIAAAAPPPPKADHLQDPTPAPGEEEDDISSVVIQVTPQKPAPALDDETTNPQKVYTRLLISRFLSQRQQLHTQPTMAKLAELSNNCPISFPPGNTHAEAEWTLLISTKPPLSTQLQYMDQPTILALLSLIQETHLTKNPTLTPQTSAWIYSLLARLDDVGTMTNSQVSTIRELGKRAVFLLLSFTKPELAAGLAQTFEENVSEDIGLATPPTENTIATLDMILVVICEVFGQRDLGEFRPTWTPEKEKAV